MRGSSTLSVTFISCASLAVASCTSVQSRSIDPAASSPSNGLIYYLPARTLQVDVKYVINDCGVSSDGKSAVLNYDVAPTLTSLIVGDRRHAFLIAKGLTGKALKDLNLEVTQYENGTLKSINAVADDKTAETATNVFSGGLKFALGLAGFGLFGAETKSNTWLSLTDKKSEVARVRAVCGVRVTDALLQVAKLRATFDAAREADEAQAKLSGAVSSAEKAVIDARAALKAAQETKEPDDLALAQSTLSSAIKKLSAARGAAEKGPSGASTSKLSQQIAAIIERDLTFSASKYDIPTDTIEDYSFTIDYQVERLNAIGIAAAVRMKSEVQVRPTMPAVDSSTSATAPAVQGSDGKLRDGIWMRSPATAIVRICASDCVEASTRLTQVISIPQWGHLTAVPIKNIAFSKSGTKMAFAPDGALTSFNFESTAAAERASKAFSDSGDSFIDFVTKQRALTKELSEAKTGADKAAIQQQIDLLTLRQQLAQGQTSTKPEQDNRLSDLDFQIKQAQKQLELLDAQKKLEAQRSGGQ